MNFYFVIVLALNRLYLSNYVILLCLNLKYINHIQFGLLKVLFTVGSSVDFQLIRIKSDRNEYNNIFIRKPMKTFMQK